MVRIQLPLSVYLRKRKETIPFLVENPEYTREDNEHIKKDVALLIFDDSRDDKFWDISLSKKDNPIPIPIGTLCKESIPFALLGV